MKYNFAWLNMLWERLNSVKFLNSEQISLCILINSLTPWYLVLCLTSADFGSLHITVDDENVICPSREGFETILNKGR